MPKTEKYAVTFPMQADAHADFREIQFEDQNGHRRFYFHAESEEEAAELWFRYCQLLASRTPSSTKPPGIFETPKRLLKQERI